MGEADEVGLDVVLQIRGLVHASKQQREVMAEEYEPHTRRSRAWQRAKIMGPAISASVEAHLGVGVGRCCFLVSSGDAVALVKLATALFLREGLRVLKVPIEEAAFRQLQLVQVVGDRVDEPNLDATQQQ